MQQMQKIVMVSFLNNKHHGNFGLDSTSNQQSPPRATPRVVDSNH
jgi:hypothetical protein